MSHHLDRAACRSLQKGRPWGLPGPRGEGTSCRFHGTHWSFWGRSCRWFDNICWGFSRVPGGRGRRQSVPGFHSPAGVPSTLHCGLTAQLCQGEGWPLDPCKAVALPSSKPPQAVSHAWESSTAPQTVLFSSWCSSSSPLCSSQQEAHLRLDIQTSHRTGHPEMFHKLHQLDRTTSQGHK